MILPGNFPDVFCVYTETALTPSVVMVTARMRRPPCAFAQVLGLQLRPGGAPGRPRAMPCPRAMFRGCGRLLDVWSRRWATALPGVRACDRHVREHLPSETARRDVCLLDSERGGLHRVRRSPQPQGNSGWLAHACRPRHLGDGAQVAGNWSVGLYQPCGWMVPVCTLRVAPWLVVHGRRVSCAAVAMGQI